MRTIDAGKRWRKSAAAAVLLAALAGCGDVGGLTGGGALPAPNLEENAVARMSAETRYDQAVGCSSTARLALRADTPESLAELGMPPEFAAAGAVEFAGSAEDNALMGETAARDAIEAGAALGTDETAVLAALEADYQRLEGAFRAVAEAEPQVALFTIQDRLRRCRSAYPGV